jgi:hypothetical protein
MPARSLHLIDAGRQSFEQLGVTYGPPLDRRRRSNNLAAKPFDSLIGLEVYGRGEAECGPACVGRFRWKLITKYALPEDLGASTALSSAADVLEYWKERDCI